MAICESFLESGVYGIPNMALDDAKKESLLFLQDEPFQRFLHDNSSIGYIGSLHPFPHDDSSKESKIQCHLHKCTSNNVMDDIQDGYVSKRISALRSNRQSATVPARNMVDTSLITASDVPFFALLEDRDLRRYFAAYLKKEGMGHFIECYQAMELFEYSFELIFQAQGPADADPKATAIFVFSDAELKCPFSNESYDFLLSQATLIYKTYFQWGAKDEIFCDTSLVASVRSTFCKSSLSSLLLRPLMCALCNELYHILLPRFKLNEEYRNMHRYLSSLKRAAKDGSMKSTKNQQSMFKDCFKHDGDCCLPFEKLFCMKVIPRATFFSNPEYIQQFRGFLLRDNIKLSNRISFLRDALEFRKGFENMRELGRKLDRNYVHVSANMHVDLPIEVKEELVHALSRPGLAKDAFDSAIVHILKQIVDIDYASFVLDSGYLKVLISHFISVKYGTLCIGNQKAKIYPRSSLSIDQDSTTILQKMVTKNCVPSLKELPVDTDKHRFEEVLYYPKLRSYFKAYCTKKGIESLLELWIHLTECLGSDHIDSWLKSVSKFLNDVPSFIQNFIKTESEDDKESLKHAESKVASYMQSNYYADFAASSEFQRLLVARHVESRIPSKYQQDAYDSMISLPIKIVNPAKNLSEQCKRSVIEMTQFPNAMALFLAHCKQNFPQVVSVVHLIIEIEDLQTISCSKYRNSREARLLALLHPLGVNEVSQTSVLLERIQDAYITYIQSEAFSNMVETMPQGPNIDAALLLCASIIG